MSILRRRAVLFLSPALGWDGDAAAGGLYRLLGRASPGHAVAEVVDTSTHAHPPSKLETGPLWSYMVNNVL